MFPEIYDIKSPLVMEHFHVKGTVYTLPPIWSNPQNAFAVHPSHKWLQPSTEGELIYNHTRLNLLRDIPATYSRYNVIVGFEGFRGSQCSDEFHFEVRQRRSGDTWLLLLLKLIPKTTQFSYLRSNLG